MADSAAPERWFGETTLTASGYAASLPVCGQTVSGTALRRALGLRSACFTIRYQDKAWGEGLVTEAGPAELVIDFDGVERRFAIPEAFDNGYLTLAED